MIKLCYEVFLIKNFQRQRCLHRCQQETCVAQWVIFAFWWRKTTTHHSGVDWRHFFLIPFGGIAVSCLHIHSAYLVLSGEQVKWKGRQYVVNKHKTIQVGGALEKAKLRDASDG